MKGPYENSVFADFERAQRFYAPRVESYVVDPESLRNYKTPEPRPYMCAFPQKRSFPGDPHRPHDGMLMPLEARVVRPAPKKATPPCIRPGIGKIRTL